MEPERNLAEHGLNAAILRLQESSIDLVNFTHLVPLAEALMWVYALHEWHRQQMGSTAFFSDCRERGPVVPAIVWARAKVQHHIADVTRILGAQIDWVPLGLMAGNRGSEPDRYGRDVLYEEYVGGRPIAEPLRDAYAFLQTLSDPARNRPV